MPIVRFWRRMKVVNSITLTTMEQITTTWRENKAETERPEKIITTMKGEGIFDLRSIDFEQIVEDRGEFQINFQLGEKNLELTITERSDRKIYACSRIDNIEGKDNSIKDKTTRLHEEMKLALQEISDQLGMPVYLEYSTDYIMDDGRRNPMRKWATSPKKGERIFKWERKWEDKADKCTFYRKAFYPKR